MDHYRKLENMYADAPVNDHFDPDLTISEGAAVVEMPITAEFHHPLGAAHGSVVFKCLDDAAFFAANSLVEDVFVLTTDFNLYFERPISEGTLRAEGTVVNENPNQLIAEAVATDDDGNEIARGSGTFQRSTRELTADIGYEL